MHRVTGNEQVGFVAHRDHSGLDIDVDDESLRSPTGQADAATLAERHHLHGGHRADGVAAPIHHCGWTHRDAVAQERRAATRARDEAHVLAVGLGSGAQAEARGVGAHIRLGHLPNGKQRAGQLVLVDHVHDVALILRAVEPPLELVARGGRGHACMVSRGHGVEAEQVGAFAQPRELHVPVALDARIGRDAYGVGLHVRRHHVLLEVLAEVEHEMVDAQLLGDTSRVVDVADAAAPGVTLSTPQAHRDAHHVMALFHEQRCCDGRVHTTAHCDHDLHARPAPPLRKRRTDSMMTRLA